MAASMTAFWDKVLFSLFEKEQSFRAAYCLHHHQPDDEGSTYH
jgi:hypothetical protein